MAFTDILYSKQDGVATIKFNRAGKLNSLSTNTWSELNVALDDFEADGDARVLVLTGDGRAFSAGDDISEFAEIAESLASCGAYVRKVLGSMLRVEKVSKPVIAAVNGLAMGGGCELALAADIIIASEKATFALPEGRIGAMAPFGALRLPQIVGSKKTLELLLTCDTIDANEAHRIGLVSKVVPPDRLEAEALAMAKKIVLHAPMAAKFVKTLVGARGDAVEQAVSAATLLMGSGDLKEGYEAFTNRRQPVFKGQ